MDTFQVTESPLCNSTGFKSSRCLYQRNGVPARQGTGLEVHFKSFLLRLCGQKWLKFQQCSQHPIPANHFSSFLNNVPENTFYEFMRSFFAAFRRGKNGHLQGQGTSKVVILEVVLMLALSIESL